MHVNWADVISHFEEIYMNIKGAGGCLTLKKGEYTKKISLGKKNTDTNTISSDN